MTTPVPLPGLDELAQFSTRAAKAAALLSTVRDEDVDLATTPREEVYRIGGRTLYRIALDAPKRVATPILVTYAMVGRWTILDLQQDRSFLRSCAASPRAAARSTSWTGAIPRPPISSTTSATSSTFISTASST
jgi:polyhydroxyalkanoate synthase subunit PhaC